MNYDYVIVGGGLAGASAIEGIRAHDASGSILLLSRENHPPYHRPPLSKGLWREGGSLDALPVHPSDYYRTHGVELALRHDVVELDRERRTLWDDRGDTFGYGRLLLATGGVPRPLHVPGADHESLHYFRGLEDYLYLRQRVERVRHAMVLGAGFIGLELAAALCQAGKEVTLVYPETAPLHRVLPRDVGLFVADYFRRQGVETVSGERIVRFQDQGGEITAFASGGGQVTTEIAIAGLGIVPATELAEASGLEAAEGIEVDEFGATADPRVFAAGDVTVFPCLPLGQGMHIEHWDHARHHGLAVGANMAGAGKPYDRLPMFDGGFFDIAWEAVGQVESHLDTQPVWNSEYTEGVVYYLWDHVVRGVLLWNVRDRVEWAREVVRAARPTTRDEREAMARG